MPNANDLPDFLKRAPGQLQASAQPFLPLVAPILPAFEPRPLPAQVSAGNLIVDGKLQVVIQIADATGVKLVFLPGEAGMQVADVITQASRMAISGIHVAPGSTVRNIVMSAEPGHLGVEPTSPTSPAVPDAPADKG